MATLIGREVWAVTGSLIHGTVTGQKDDPGEVITVQTEYGNRYLHPSYIRLSAKEIIPEVENEILYWKDRLKELEKEADE